MCFGAGGPGGDRPLASSSTPMVPGGSQDPANPGLPSLAPPPPGQSPMSKLFSPFGLVGGAAGLKHLSPLAGLVNLFK